MTLTYIYHSGFVIETTQFFIVIDYYKDTGTDNMGFVHDVVLKSDKKIYVLSSHSHHDHFTPEVLSWKKENRNIQYIFSDDIIKAGLVKDNEIVFLSKKQTYSDKFVTIKAFGSTDLGISFLIKADGKVIFHAGDLNNWHWKDESTTEEIKEAEIAYLSELNLLTEDVKYIDVVMFPVDPRLGADYMLGANQFIGIFGVGLFAPMHFGEEYKKANAFDTYAKEKGCQFFRIEKKGDNILL